MATLKNYDKINLFPGLLPEKKTKEIKTDFSFELTDALTAPILTFSQSWADCIPERFLKLVPLARLMNLRSGKQEATWVEGVVYIYTRTLEAPMDSEWTDIYTHISCKTLEVWFKEDRWKYVQAPPVLSKWMLKKLNDLLRHIYTKRREILKNRIKEAEKNINIEATAKGTKKVRTQPAVQQTTFNF